MTHFSLISAVYNVGRYLPDYLRSLDEQTFDHAEVEVILVNDGSTDFSAALINEWKATTDFSVIVIDQSNAGQGAARNTGIEHARGSWVSFPDPDDILDPGYLASVYENLCDADDVAMAATHLIDFWETTGEVKDSHALRFRFKHGTQVFNLDRFPRNIHLHAASAFFRRDRLVEFGIAFDPRIRPVFEDAHFVQSYLLTFAVRTVIFDDSARYLYRRRADGSSTLQTSGADERRYTDVLRFGLLDILRRAGLSGERPRWLQNVVLYDLFWILRAEESLSPKTGALSEKTAEEFCELLRQIRVLLDPQAIEAFDIIKVSLTQREVLLHGISGDNWSWGFLQALEFDEKKQLIKLRYHYTGDQPEERLTFRGSEKPPMYAKTRTFKYLGRPLLHERILWISSRGTITAQLDGIDVPIEDTQPQPKKFILRQARSEGRVTRRDTAATPQPRTRTSLNDRVTIVLADSSYSRRKYAEAWVFMDRPDNAGDNAEHLFKYVRRHHNDRNAWFVVDQESAAWKRLRAEGIDRLVAHGSREWRALCLNAELLISSHIDVDVISPFTLSNGRRPEWGYVFLQHGVTMNDISAWLNTKRPQLVVTTTEPEHRSIVGDGSSYVLSGKETAMTGMPRYDRLVELDATLTESRRSAITIMPTWRKELGTALAKIVDPDEKAALFRQSSWWQQWSALLSSERLADAAREHGLNIRFMPHPGFDALIGKHDAPNHVELVSHSTHDFQTVLVESALIVTDLSSVAFDAAFVDRPIVYFQFDAESIFGGGHIAKPGYFSFDDDGFGPVVSAVNEATQAISSLLSGTDPLLEEYARRRVGTFTLPKGDNCKRTFDAIVRSSKAVSPKAGTAPQRTLQAQPTRYLEAARGHDTVSATTVAG